MSEIKFRRDTSFRKQFFIPDSFAHPAKMDAQLLIWIVERYTKPGEVILDPMAGSGTTCLACTLGRDVILVELEEKFCKMCADNWEQVRMRPQLGSTMGDCRIIQGDARQLEGLLADKIIGSPPYGNRLSDAEVDDGDPQRMSYRQALGKVDKCIFSPPYAESFQRNQSYNADELPQSFTKHMGKFSQRRHPAPDIENNNISNLPYGNIDSIITSPPYASPWGVSDENRPDATIAREERHKLRHPDKYRPPLVSYSESMENIGNLPYGQIDKIITSPPYEGSDVSQTHMTSDKRGDPSDPNYRPSWKSKLEEGYAESKRPYHEVDSIITSPPYEGTTGKGKEIGSEGHAVGAFHYGDSNAQIGNLKSDSYLEAMLLVYQQCHKVLKPQGLMILVVKNFIRNKQVIRLDLDTLKLCEQAGFSFVERHSRKLPAQSFWRIIYHQKHPEVEQINHEDILVFGKEFVKCQETK